MRHVYWTRPDTTTHRPDDDQHAPVELLSELGRTAVVHENGSISWSGLNALATTETTTVALKSALRILQPSGVELNETDSGDLITKSVHDVVRDSGGGQPINAVQLRRKAEQKASEFFRQPSDTYSLVSAMSIDRFDQFPIDAFDATFQSCSRGDFPYPKCLHEFDGLVSAHLKRSRYHAVLVQAEAISCYQAGEDALRKLNALCGVWNLVSTYQRLRMDLGSSPTRKWIGSIYLAPIHTIHRQQGEVHEAVYWYEPNYTQDAKLFRPNGGWGQFVAKSSELIRLIHAAPYREELIDLLSQYNEAVGQSDVDVAFLKIWSILERITDTVGSNYDLTIKRAVRPYINRKLETQTLTLARRARNAYVHSSRSTESSQLLCCITKKYVDRLLLLLIRNDYMLGSMSEYIEFLSLPTDRKRLERTHFLYSRAMYSADPDEGGGI